MAIRPTSLRQPVKLQEDSKRIQLRLRRAGQPGGRCPGCLEFGRRTVWTRGGNTRECSSLRHDFCMRGRLVSARDLAFMLWSLCWALLTLCWGLLNVFSPQTLDRLSDWTARADMWSRARAAPGRHASGSFLVRLVACLVSVAMSIFIFEYGVLGFLLGRSSSATGSQTRASGGYSHSSSVCIPAFVMIGFGVLLIVEPKIYLHVIEKGVPNRKLLPGESARFLRGGRVFGTILTLVGVCTLFFWCRRTY